MGLPCTSFEPKGSIHATSRELLLEFWAEKSGRSEALGLDEDDEETSIYEVHRLLNHRNTLGRMEYADVVSREEKAKKKWKIVALAHPPGVVSDGNIASKRLGEQMVGRDTGGIATTRPRERDHGKSHFLRLELPLPGDSAYIYVSRLLPPIA